MGSIVYYVASLKFRDVAQLIKQTDEIHSSKKLSDWIQRQIVRGHSKKIADYLLSEEDRFFNALVIGVYGGRPSWVPLAVSSSAPEVDFEISDDQRDELNASIGLLTLEGKEKLFAIDGQHRVAGIKQALKDSDCVAEDEVVALFVGHERTVKGAQRTRRLFTRLNTTARAVSEADRIALEEDDGFAVVTRRMFDEFKLFGEDKFVSLSPTASLPSNDDKSVTTIISLYHQVRELYSRTLVPTTTTKRDFESSRPPDEAIDALYAASCTFWTLLGESVSVVAKVLGGKATAGSFRTAGRNHLLMRPVGQRAYAGAVGALTARGAPLEHAVEKLSRANLWVHDPIWAYILWDPVNSVMLKSAALAETFLLHQVGEKGRSTARTKSLDAVLEKRARTRGE
jgi:DNA sulfur modification protein DndB